METLTEMFDRIIKSVWKQGDMHWEWGASDITPIGIETSVGRLDSFSDVKPLLRSQTDVKRCAFDKGAQARGGTVDGRTVNL